MTTLNYQLAGNAKQGASAPEALLATETLVGAGGKELKVDANVLDVATGGQITYIATINYVDAILATTASAVAEISFALVQDGSTTYTWVAYADTDSGEGISLDPSNKRFMGLAPNKITSTPVLTANLYTWSPLFDNVIVGGRNLVIRADELKDQVFDAEGVVEAGVGFSIMSDTIKVEPGEVYAFSKTGSEEPDEGYWRYNLLDGEGALISTLTNSANAFYWVAPADVFSIQVSYPTDALPQIEQGNVITGWSPAPEDVSDSLVDLTTAISKTTSIHYITSLSKFTVDPDMTVGSVVYETEAQKIWRYEGLGEVAPYTPIWTDITSVMLSQALTIALNTQQVVDGKITTFAQATQPIIVSITSGDTWINSELLFPNILFYENGAWINKQVEMSFIQNSAPKATLVAGETWLNTVGKKIYVLW